MKKLLSLLLVLLFCVPAFALSGTEYRAMLSNPEFARADKRINDIWDSVWRIAPSSVKDFLTQAQTEWFKYDMDYEANMAMEEKYSRERAYAKAMDTCADKLQLLKAALSKSDKPKKLTGKYVRIGGKGSGWLYGQETGYLDIEWINKKKSEVKIRLIVVGGGSEEYGPDTGDWEWQGVIKNRVLAVSAGYDAHIIFVFKDDKTVLIETTNEFSRFGGIGVTFGGVYVRE